MVRDRYFDASVNVSCDSTNAIFEKKNKKKDRKFVSLKNINDMLTETAKLHLRKVSTCWLVCIKMIKEKRKSVAIVQSSVEEKY